MFVKRGTITTSALWFMFDIVLAVVIFFLLSSFVDRAAETTTFEKNFLARDTALLVETLYAAPGTVELDYTQDSLWFTFNFQENIVQVYDATLNDNPPAIEKSIFPYTGDNNIAFKNRIITPLKKIERKESIFPTRWLTTNRPEQEKETTVTLNFKKTNQELVINSEVNFNKLSCPIIESSMPSKITIVPKTILGQTSTFTDSLRLRLNADLKDFLELKDEFAIIEIREGNPKALVSQGSQRSRKLACLIINELSDTYQINPEITISDDQTLTKAKIAIIIQIPKELQNQKTIEAIIKGVEQYG